MKISVIVPVYNQQPYIAAAIDSLIAQTYQNIEIILIDDGSSDNSIDVLRHYEEKDARIVVISKENEGVSATRNYGLRIAKGDIIAFLDADDLVHPDRFSVTAQIFSNYPDCDVMFHDIVKTDINGTPFTGSYLSDVEFTTVAKEYLKPLTDSNYQVSSSFYKFMFLNTTAMHTSSIAFKRTEETLLFDQDLFAGEDADLWIRLAAQAQQIIYVDSVLSYYRQHDESITKNYIKYYRGVNDYLEKQNQRYNKNLSEQEQKLLNHRILDNKTQLAYQYRINGFIKAAKQQYMGILKVEFRMVHFINLLKCYLTMPTQNK